MAASFFCSSLSRSLFLRILATQNSWFVVGILQQAELSMLLASTRWPCQKQPFTKMQVLYFLSTKSGCPGSRLWLSLYLKPLFHNPRRTIISGLVSFDRIAAIILCRSCFESLSIFISSSQPLLTLSIPLRQASQNDLVSVSQYLVDPKCISATLSRHPSCLGGTSGISYFHYCHQD